MELYIDDMLVKSQQTGDHIQHLTDTFQILRKFNMKLNPEKYAFGVSSSKFLGFLVSNRDIEVNHAQIKVIEEILDILTSKKEVQRLTGRITALGRFISKSSEKCFKFFSALKKQNQFEWSEECQQEHKNLMAYLLNPPLLAKPKDGEKLLIHLAYGILPEDKKKAQALRQKTARYCLNQGNLCRKMFGGPLARCLGPSQMKYVMREIHEGHCENHAGGRSLVKTIIRAGYYWPKMEEDAEKFVARCDKCQRYAKISTGETLFSLVYGAEALIPVEIGEPSTRYNQATEESNEEEMRVNLDLVEDMRETTLIRMTVQKQVIEWYYNWKACLRYFKIRDYVLNNVFQSTRTANPRKLSPNWEGPYKIHGIARKGAYELEMLDGKILPSNWNVVHLKRYYF
uniref:Uncharacterized protein LOC104217081 n=1 Tax=Nicotiana sylvestris TaxID=4096 RepID=A0A1U7VT32_NICSY|nr:PREDICTED: uncharacterized protein LOC104217081 [Nicotiana sylvestris]